MRGVSLGVARDARRRTTRPLLPFLIPRAARDDNGTTTRHDGATTTTQGACRAILALLSAPAPESPLNCDAGNMLRAGDQCVVRRRSFVVVGRRLARAWCEEVRARARARARARVRVLCMCVVCSVGGGDSSGRYLRNLSPRPRAAPRSPSSTSDE